MSVLTANHLYYGTALNVINKIIKELDIEQEVMDCFDDNTFMSAQELLKEVIPKLVRIAKEKKNDGTIYD